jgi:alcohol dehydrogenase (NADP+)
MRSLSFANGDQMPILGLGTWRAEPDQVYSAVKEAIRFGYRHIDCATFYGNEAEIGQALRDSFWEDTVTRDEMWITSKLWNDERTRGCAIGTNYKPLRPAIELS